MSWFRVVVVLGEALTIAITWPLWQVRTIPPNLPLLPVPQLDLGWLLLASLAPVLTGRRRWLLLHTLVLAFAMASDQMRLQPQMLSFLWLAWGCAEHAGSRLIGRAHLIALWAFSGIHKLTSPDYFERLMPWLWHQILPGAPTWLAPFAGGLLACSELLLAALAAVPATRRFVGWGALGLHLALLAALSPIGAGRNPSVWPWNAVLALSGFALVAGWRDPVPDALRGAGRAVRVIAVALLVTPALYSLRLVDAAFAHCLYSANTPAGLVIDQDASTAMDLDDALGTWPRLRAPIPPAVRLYEQAFAAVDRPGLALLVRDPRPMARFLGQAERLYEDP